MVHPTHLYAQGPGIEPEPEVIERATEAWMNGSSPQALDILEKELRKHSSSVTLRKLQGDILATTRRNQEALEHYKVILKEFPESLAVRWAKWSLC